MKPKRARVPAAAALLMVAAVLGGVLWFGLVHAEWSSSRSSSGLVNAGPPAAPPVITVNSTADAVDANPGDGTCATAAGDCTLRAAIQETNALAGADTIDLPAGIYTLIIAGQDEDAAATGDLDITDDLTIIAGGQSATVVDGGALDRVLHVHSGSTVDISDVTIQNGSASWLYDGGGIWSAGDLTLTNVTVSDNTAEYSYGGGGIFISRSAATLNGVTVSGNTTSGLGGGIYSSYGTVTLTNSTVSGNIATSGGGGGILKEGGDLTVTDSTITANLGSDGGGIANLFGTLSITNATVSDNTATSWGGGILTAGEATLTGVTLSGNTALSGGGIMSSGDLTLINVTVSGNAADLKGGGIHNGLYGDPDESVTLTNVTVTGNTAAVAGGGIFNSSGDTAMARNTIVANSISGGDCSGVITSAGHNVDSDGTCALAGTGDLSNTDPLLGPLQNNAGPTFTHALLTGSPAIDAGDNALCPATDQRGVARPLDGDGDGTAICDIGAYEFERESITVDIDVKPGSDPNSTNLGSRGVIPVAILTTPDFDATDVDPSSVLFEGASPVHHALEAVDGDGDADLIMHFRTQHTEIAEDATEACLTGQTVSGQDIQGCDIIRIVPPWLDSDADGFGDAVEATVGTDQFAACPVSSAHDAWPPDFDHDRDSDILDVLTFKWRFGSPGPGKPYSARHDLRGQDGIINIFDVVAVKPYFNESCTP